MRRRLWMVFALAALGAACADGPTDSTGAESGEVTELGGLAISLTGTDDHGDQYRLRNAEFLVQRLSPPGSDAGSTPLVTLSTELDPDAPYLTTRLGRGPYSVTIRGQWYLERLTPNGYERVERAVLLSGATQRTYVFGTSGAALVFYRFGVDGLTVDFDSGDLRVDIDVDLPRDAGADAGVDAGAVDAGTDAGMDAGVDAGADASADAGTDAGADAGTDASSGVI